MKATLALRAKVLPGPYPARAAHFKGCAGRVSATTCDVCSVSALRGGSTIYIVPPERKSVQGRRRARSGRLGPV